MTDDDDPIAVARAINERHAANTVIAEHARRLPLTHEDSPRLLQPTWSNRVFARLLKVNERRW